MAVIDLTNSSLQLVFNDGVDLSTGRPVYKNKTLNNVKLEATADQLYGVAQAFASLQTRPLYNIVRRDTSEVSAE